LSTAAPEVAVRGARSSATLARRTYAAALKRGAVRRKLHAHTRDHQLDKAHSKAYAHSSALAVVMDQMERLSDADSTLEELMRFPETLYEHALELAGRTMRSLDALDLDESRLDADQDMKQMQRRVHGESPATLRREADVCSHVASVNTELAITLRRRANRLEGAQVVS
jgi:hypothetical protein